MEFTLINKDTSTFIPTSSIVQQEENYIIVNTNNCWKLIPASSIKEERDYPEYFEKDNVPDMDIKKDYNTALAYSDSVETQYVEKLEYRFGFKDLHITTRQAAPVSGIISMPIPVEEAEQITVNCTIQNQDTGSVEFSILDNTDEIPILPNNSRAIIKERLFFGIPTRFIIDQTKPTVLYEDNIITSKDYTNLTVNDFQDHIYALSYTTIEDSSFYKPASNQIKIKIIIRQYDITQSLSIEDLIIHKHGETLTWNSNQ